MRRDGAGDGGIEYTVTETRNSVIPQHIVWPVV